MRQRTRLIRDGTGRFKLKTSLPGGRYQLSLDDGAVNALRDGLGIQEGGKVPDTFVKFFVATRDAWFPHQRDVDDVLKGLPSGEKLTKTERAELISYLENKRIGPGDSERIKKVFDESPLSNYVEFDSLSIQEKSLPAADVLEELTGISNKELQNNETVSETKEEPGDLPSVESTEIVNIPGIATVRGEKLVKAGFRTIEEVADSRPADISEVSGMSEQLATVAVEGAREELGYNKPTSTRLSEETGVDESTFESALSSLAASGVPPSKAGPVLRTVYGPQITEINNVSGAQAYFLWENGFRSPVEVANSDVDELCEVPQIGQKTAPEIIDSAKKLIKG